MKNSELAGYTAGAVSTVIGVYMIANFLGNNPPTVSGVAFTALGIGKILEHYL